MSGSHTAYEKAVALFAKIMNAPNTELCTRPADLARALDRSSSTNFRAIAEAEAAGLIKRDLRKHYLKGAVARRIGFSAFGFGQVSDIVEPILIDVRERTRRSSIIGVIDGDRLFVGPFSMGRGRDYTCPDQLYGTDPTDLANAQVECVLHPLAGGKPGLTLRALAFHVAGAHAGIVGVVAAHGFERSSEETFDVLEVARSRLADSNKAQG
ncbi:hypothetical protein FE840_019830 (plasmid) [Peteryoungia desertarenae]|uniref:Uncharacterized protein n=1 Tax=Peteryoungia desertarenae TaxID=1813451 RepID=A0ABX6QUE4_9HYPH|nr:hypothetical protein [Peteryoungia desertarenae]QLF71852.1 hypothetical protein FE840_019830 [Peteryoungia desertarenae]